MPLPKPHTNETESAFMTRCMADPTMEEEYPDSDQRLAVCNSLWENERDVGTDADFKQVLKEIKDELNDKE